MSVVSAIIDAHLTYSPGSAAARSELLDGAGVASAVAVSEEPSDAASLHAATETADDPRVSALVVWVDPAAADLKATLDALTAHPKVKGVLVDARAQQANAYPASDAVVAGLEQVGARGLGVDMLVEPRQINAVSALAERLPDLRIALTHMGSPYIGRSEREPWGVAMMNLAPRPNVWVKATGLVGLDVADWRVAHLSLFVEAVVRLFGYRRMLMGSGWPAGSDRATYAQVLEAVRLAAGPMSDAQVERVCAGSAREFYRIG